MKFFQRKSHPPQTEPNAHQKPNWLKISLIANIALVVVAVTFAAGGAVVHQSDTNPNLCGLCHIMQPNVQSYLTSNHLDNVHHQAGVQCKGCHDYPLDAEITAGVNYLTGNYFVTVDGNIPKREFEDDMCLKCHISAEHLANQTDFLVRNPHFSHWGDLKCKDCHVSHGEQINLCGDCHDNGEQRMVEGPIIPRAENPWANSNAPRPDTSSGVAEEITNQ